MQHSEDKPVPPLGGLRVAQRAESSGSLVFILFFTVIHRQLDCVFVS